jgi:hypothetical protein
MPYELVLAKQPKALDKAVGESPLLSGISERYPCYALYYPSAAGEPELEEALRKLGKAAGKNLFVSLGTLGDEEYPTIAKVFSVRRNPVVIVTALAEYAAPPDQALNSYVRLDDPTLLSSPDRTLKCIQELSNLYLRGEVATALKAAHSAERAALLAAIGGYLAKALKTIGDFVAERDISVSFAEGRFELNRAGK